MPQQVTSSGVLQRGHQGLFRQEGLGAQVIRLVVDEPLRAWGSHARARIPRLPQPPKNGHFQFSKFTQKIGY